MRFTRRSVLTSALGAGGLLGGLSLPRLLSAATPTDTDRRFVFAYFKGGWDNLLSLDPRDPDVYTASAVSETGTEPAYRSLLDASLGDDLSLIHI